MGPVRPSIVIDGPSCNHSSNGENSILIPKKRNLILAVNSQNSYFGEKASAYGARR